MDDTWFFFVLAVSMLWLVVIPIMGALIGRPKGRGVLGYLLGLLLGPVGLIVVAIVGPSEDQKRIDAQRAAHATLANRPKSSPEGDGKSNCKKCAQPLTGNICKACGASNPEFNPSVSNSAPSLDATTSAPLKPRTSSNGYAVPAIILSVIGLASFCYSLLMIYFFGDWAVDFGGVFSLSSVALFTAVAAVVLSIVSLAKKDKSRVLAISLSSATILLTATLFLV